MMTVTVVGAGFSGLTVAYYLQRAGFKVVLIEKENRSGGLISTLRTKFGLVETAANAALSSQTFEALLNDLDIKMASAHPLRSKRFVFWETPKRWPLSKRTSLTLLKNTLAMSWFRQRKPVAGESISDWGTRFVNREFEERLLTPALQGVYAGDPKELSASMIVNSMTEFKTPKGKQKGSVAPEHGMGELIEGLTARIIENGGDIQYDQDFQLAHAPKAPVVIATSAWAASEILKNSDTVASKILASCDSLPLITVTAFFAPQEGDLEGFGCLFPQAQKFHALGVLFNHCIFQERSSVRSETWILGGALDQGIASLSDEDILEKIYLDRKKLFGFTEAAMDFKLTRWPRAIPHYTVAWEKSLSSLSVKEPVYLHGNYLGQLGLARILENSKSLAEKIARIYAA